LWGRVSLSRGLCSPFGLHFSSRFGAGIWWHGSPPGFSV
jgi:hypothetical protein